MGSSTKKKKERKADFQKQKLKVGKARPKNTNATDTSFTAKSIILKQQSLSESGRDATSLFTHNLSLLGSKNETQRRDALSYLATFCHANKNLPQPASAVLAKAQPLILDGSRSVREQLLKLLKALPSPLGPLDQILLYTRAGMSHLSTDIRLSSLDVLDWLLDNNGEAIMSIAGGWVKTLRTFQNLLSWHSRAPTGTKTNGAGGTWTSSKPSSSMGSNKLLVRQLQVLSHLLTAALTKPKADPEAAARRAAQLFPLWHTDAHMLPTKSNPFGYLNLFGAPRDVESEVYDDADERSEIFNELGLLDAFKVGVTEAKREGGEVGRAASQVDKALRLPGAG